MADPVTLKLTEPVVFAGQTVTELVIQPMRPKHWRGLPRDGSNEEKEMALLSKLAGQPPGVIDEMCMADYMEAQRILMGFLASQGTGKT